MANQAPEMIEKWGEPVAKRGFAQIPNYLLLINQFLEEERKLSPTEMLVLIQLVSSWWKKEELPFPSMGTLSKRCGVSERQIQRAINSLEGREFIKRVHRRQRGVVSSNSYDLTPLVEFLEGLSKLFPNIYPRKIT